jgi:hypothetical protein
MNLSLKAKCSGCMALDMQGTDFICKLGVSILTDKDGTQPQPNHEKCYKPTTQKEYKDANNLHKKLVKI